MKEENMKNNLNLKSYSLASGKKFYFYAYEENFLFPVLEKKNLNE